MCRWLISLALAVSVVSSGFAQSPSPFRGVWNITSGKIRQPDGSFVNVSGLQVPFTVQPVGETRKQVEEQLGIKLAPYSNSNPNDSLVTVYNNDRPDNYFAGTLEGPMPSALDDISISPTGVNAGVLEEMTVGWHIPDRSFVFAIFGFYNNYNPVAPAGTSAFSNVMVDTFGGPFFADPFTFPVVPGEYMITFGITVSSMGITFNDENVYFLQQFRIGSDTGPFNDDWYMFFSGGGNPLVGSSVDFFWYDNNPRDGIYAEEEKDLFSTEPGHPFQANFALRLDIDSNVQFFDLSPDAIFVSEGSAVSGNTISMRFNNQAYWIGRPDYIGGDFEYPLGVIVSTFSPSTNLVSLIFSIDAKMDIEGAEQVVWLWNWNTSQWVKFDSTLINTTDVLRQFVVTQNPSHYVNQSTGEMRAYLQYRELLFDFGDFRANIDMVKWRVGTL